MAFFKTAIRSVVTAKHGAMPISRGLATFRVVASARSVASRALPICPLLTPQKVAVAHDHSHAVVGKDNERALWLSLYLTGAFMIAEVITGVLSNSLALISDAAHMFTDTAALAIALVAIRVGKRPADVRR